MQYALRRQCEVALRYYLNELHQLGSELSLSGMLVPIDVPMQALAERSPDHDEHRQDEPYRRALTGMYARLAATLKQLTGVDAARHLLPPKDPYVEATELLSDLRIIESSLCHHHAEAIAAQRLRPLIRAVDVFGFHLATLDLRQSSDKHEALLEELLREARIEPAYAKLEEPARQVLLLRLLNDVRPLRIPGARYSQHAQDEIAIFEMALGLRQTFGAQAIRHYIISHTESVSDLLEVLLLQKEMGLLRGTLNEQAVADLIVVPLFETIPDLRNARVRSRTSCSATATATRTAEYSPATGSSIAVKSRWWSCLTS
jgi:phosphoenolpyruvate carboxylase